jgi:uridine kinase
MRIPAAIVALPLALASLTSALAYEHQPFIIVVAGGSASGKTFTAHRIAEALGSENVTVFSMDNYYAPERQPQRFYRDGGINYDHPSALDMGSAANAIQYLRSGFDVRVREYTYGQNREAAIIHYPSRPFIIVEGIFALYPEIANLADLRIFVDVDYNTRLASRLKRDQEERGLSVDAIREYFDRVVQPMHQKYVQNSAIAADIVITSPRDPAQLAKVIDSVRSLSAQTRQTKASILTEVYNRTVEEIAAASEGALEVLPIEALTPTQTEIGNVNLSNKSYLLDRIIRESAMTFDLATRLENFLVANPIPVLRENGRNYVVDHHHLLLALHKKGLNRFLVDASVRADQVEPRRLLLVNGRQEPFTFADLENNSYRSLATLVRDLGHITKEGILHAEFAWAAFFRGKYEESHAPLTDETLLNQDRREVVVNWAIQMARSTDAGALPGYQCKVLLEPHSTQTGKGLPGIEVLHD